MSLEQKEKIARLRKDLDKQNEILHAMERSLYSTETLEKLHWRKATLMEDFKREWGAFEAAREAVQARGEQIVRLRTCILARCYDIMKDEKATPSDKKDAREKLKAMNGSSDEYARLAREARLRQLIGLL